MGLSFNMLNCYIVLEKLNLYKTFALRWYKMHINWWKILYNKEREEERESKTL